MRALVVVVDLEPLAMSSQDPLAPLRDLLAVAGDVGLHLVVARTSGGAAAALLHGFPRHLREVGAPALLLSGPAEEGTVVHGARFEHRVPGRAQWVTRRSGRDGEVLQIASGEWAHAGDPGR
ncbi:hypothetical protein AB2L27_03505 [Kineococcus sp. LSe6-4]|uniref:Isochorismatase family protein n=1 Tax=Kineococcus halophytocola TaxID=3234027 RepID=A0ABV4GWZ2_9ACTN